MTVTLSDITPVGLCVATQELFDTRRYQLNFGDNMILRTRDKQLEMWLTPMKRDLADSMKQAKFLDGHKAAIISNIDKILSLVSSRYAASSLRSVEVIGMDGKSLIKKVIFAQNFDQIGVLENEFKTKIMHPVYQLFIEQMKKTDRFVV